MFTIIAGHKRDNGDKNDEEEASHDVAVGLALVRFNDLVLPQFCNLLYTRDRIVHRWAPRVMISARGRSLRKTKDEVAAVINAD